MLIQLPNGTHINPTSVLSVVAGPDNVSIMLSSWNNFGNLYETLVPAEGQTTEELRDELAAQVNEGCA